MEQYLIDTNVISAYFSSSFSDLGMKFMDEAIDAIPNISIITQIELLWWNTNEINTRNIKSFISNGRILDISPEVIENCVNLRKNKKIKTPDAIIAATALTYDYTIITRNQKDFDNIDGLRIIDPHKM